MGRNERLRTMRGAYPRKISLKSGIQKIKSSCSKNKKTNKKRIKYE